MKTRLIGFIPFGRRLLHQQRDADRERAQELEAREETAPLGNARAMTSDGLRPRKAPTPIRRPGA